VVDEYVDRITKAAGLSEVQQDRLRETMVDLTALMVQAAAKPDDDEVLTEIAFCKLAIESLGVVSFNQVQEEAKEIASELFMKGLGIALSSL
jgi:hypothetical protein